MPKNTTQSVRRGIEPGPFHPEMGVLTMKPKHLPNTENQAETIKQSRNDTMCVNDRLTQYVRAGLEPGPSEPELSAITVRVLTSEVYPDVHHLTLIE